MCGLFSKKAIFCEFKVATKKGAILQNLKTEIDEQLIKYQIDWQQ
ncbi:hypothetical protein [Spiroplasma endosymbiont of Glossina fuscipes fuscipes]